MKTQFTRILHVAIAGIGAGIIVSWLTLLFLVGSGLGIEVLSHPGQLLTGLLGILSIGLLGMLYGSTAGVIATAVCMLPALILIHFAEKRGWMRSTYLAWGTLMGAVVGAGFVTRGAAGYSWGDLAFPGLCALGGGIAADLYVRLNRRWGRKQVSGP